MEIKGYVMIDGQNFSDQPVKNGMGTYKNRKIATGQVDDYTTGSLLDYPNFEEYYKTAAQQSLNADSKAI